jgi:hypothetical protein
MNNNNVYAYLLLGAVVLAGVGGFMMSDYSPASDVSMGTGTTSFATNMVITITEGMTDTDAITDTEATNGETS